MRIAVVAEGSSDFYALKAIFKRVASTKNKTITAFDAIQPKVDATSATQIGGGGWTRVKRWLEDNQRERCREIFSPRLFSQSLSYDLLVIHLDGDVVWLSSAFSAIERANCFHNPARNAAKIEAFIERLLDPPDDLDDKIVYAVPVLQTECWLVASVIDGKCRIPLEHRRMKLSGQRYLARKLGQPTKDAMVTAADCVGQRMDKLRKTLPSLDHFVNKVEAVL